MKHVDANGPVGAVELESGERGSPMTKSFARLSGLVGVNGSGASVGRTGPSFCFGVAVMALALLSACSSPCEKLAEVGCERAGADSEHCEKLRTQADRAEVDEQRACQRALRLVDSLGKNR